MINCSNRDIGTSTRAKKVQETVREYILVYQGACTCCIYCSPTAEYRTMNNIMPYSI